MGEGVPWKRVALIAAPFLLVAACVAAFIPRADHDPITQDGTYEVGCFGCEVPAGAWRTTGGADGKSCLWITRSSPQVTRASELDRGRAGPGEPFTVELESGQWFTTMGCDPWERV